MSMLENKEETLLVMENISLIKPELYQEAARTLSRRWTRYLAIAFGVVLMFAGLAAAEYLLLASGCVIVLLNAFSWLVIMKRDLAKLRRRYCADSWIKKIRFYADRLETKTGSGVSTYNYKDIRRICQSRHLLIIVFAGKAAAQILRKDSFTLGTADLALKFIEEMRCV